LVTIQRSAIQLSISDDAIPNSQLGPDWELAVRKRDLLWLCRGVVLCSLMKQRRKPPSPPPCRPSITEPSTSTTSTTTSWLQMIIATTVFPSTSLPKSADKACHVCQVLIPDGENCRRIASRHHGEPPLWKISTYNPDSGLTSSRRSLER